MAQKPRKKKNPYRSLWAITIQIIIDVIVVILAFGFEMESRPEGVLGHPSGAITFMAIVLMFFITLIVTAIALVILAVRLRDRERDEE